MNIENQDQDSPRKLESSSIISHSDEKLQQEETFNPVAKRNAEVVESKEVAAVTRSNTTMRNDGCTTEHTCKIIEQSTQLTTSLKAEGFAIPNDEDILSGRGTGINLHPGNVYFRKLIQSQKEQYILADPAKKRKIIKDVMQKSNEQGRRYLKHNFDADLYIQISEDEIRKKIGQALRENAPAIKRRQHDHEALQMKKRRLQEVERNQQQLNNDAGGILFPGYLPLRTELLDPTPSTSTAAWWSDHRSTSSATQPFPTSPILNSNIPITSQHLNQNHSTTSSSASTSALASSMTQTSLPDIPFIPTTTQFLWTQQLNMLMKKQQRLKIKQREIEDERDEIIQILYQMTGAFAPLIDGTDDANVATASDITTNITGSFQPQPQPQGWRHHKHHPHYQQYQHHAHCEQYQTYKNNQNHKHPDQEEQHFSVSLSCPMANDPVQITHETATTTKSTKTVAEAVAAASTALLEEPSKQSKTTDNNSNHSINSNGNKNISRDSATSSAYANINGNANANSDSSNASAIASDDACNNGNSEKNLASCQ